MTTLQDTVDYVADHPEDYTAARGLVDRLQEELAYSHVAALRYVVWVRWTKRREEDFTKALHLMNPNTPVADEYMRRIVFASGAEVGSPVWINLLRGSWAPTVQQVGVVFETVHHQHRLVRVGASWCVRHVGALEVPDSLRTPEVYGVLTDDQVDEIILQIAEV